MAQALMAALVAKVLISMGEFAYEETASWIGANDDLKKLKKTMKMIEYRVRDAEKRQEDDNSESVKLWLYRLRQLLYRADDLFDNILTLKRQKKRDEKTTFKKVGILLSIPNPINTVKLALKIRKAENSSICSLPALNLRGDLTIKFREWRVNAVVEAQRVNLTANGHLTSLSLKFQLEGEQVTLASCEIDDMLACLHLPPYLKYMEFDGYIGHKMPHRWLDGLTNLISVSISRCNSCRVVPHLGMLPHLKFLYIKDLEALEYIEDEAGILADNDYLPFLEVLELEDLPQLKGWTRPSNDTGEQKKLLFPRLFQMKLNGCRELISMPQAPKLESLDVRRINGNMLKSILTLLHDHEAPSSSSPPSSALKRLSIYMIHDELESLSISSSLCNLNTLEISYCYQLQSLMFESPNSIRHLDMKFCKSLRNISEGLQHLSVLEKLEIRCCEQLEEEQEAQDEGDTTQSWEALTRLRWLQLLEIPKMTKLPRGITCLITLQRLSVSTLENLTALPEEIGNLSQLRELFITRCPKLKSLPPSLWGLTSLEKIHILGCSDLANRYKLDGEDYHLIQHVPHVNIEG
ncbi:hypothetical protein BVRB_2g031600 [Beta vulgaris subsp. vulgaris]|uniref:Uncharacterized protein n=1 Tax=Beta vulgaris subsp. vulgaris TaxID=3555 RepID=A0A0J8FQR9_BETVV|nr:hypothetical protein BVRB_2g031600 [Beta vulgaris subsp. vulgaris]